MKDRKEFWHALPQETARWWRIRTIKGSLQSGRDNNLATARLCNGELVIDIAKPN